MTRRHALVTRQADCPSTARSPPAKRGAVQLEAVRDLEHRRPADDQPGARPPAAPSRATIASGQRLRCRRHATADSSARIGRTGPPPTELARLAERQPRHRRNRPQRTPHQPNQSATRTTQQPRPSTPQLRNRPVAAHSPRSPESPPDQDPERTTHLGITIPRKINYSRPRRAAADDHGAVRQRLPVLPRRGRARRTRTTTPAPSPHGEPAGRWYGRGAERGRAGRRGRPAEQMQALYGAADRPARRPIRRARRVGRGADGSAGRGAGTRQRTRCTAAARRRAATPRRTREELRLAAEHRPGTNVQFLDVTYCVQKSVTVLHVAFERAGSRPNAPAGDDEAAALGGAPARRSRTRSGRQRRGARLPARTRPATPGSATTAARPAGGSTRTTGSSRRSSSTTPATGDPQLHIHNADPQPRPVLRRAVAHAGLPRRSRRHRGAAGAIAERVTEAHLTRSLGCASRPARTARPARSSASRGRHGRCSPRGRGRSPRGPRELAADVRGPVRPGAEPRCSSTGSRGRRPSPPGGRSRTTGETLEQRGERSTGGRGELRRRGRAADWAPSRATSSPAAAARPSRRRSRRRGDRTALAEVQAGEGGLDPRPT